MVNNPCIRKQPTEQLILSVACATFNYYMLSCKNVDLMNGSCSLQQLFDVQFCSCWLDEQTRELFLQKYSLLDHKSFIVAASVLHVS